MLSIYWQHVLDRKVTISFGENVCFFCFFFFFGNEPKGNSTHDWLYDCHNDRWVTKMKNRITGVCLGYIWSFLIFFITLPIVSPFRLLLFTPVFSPLLIIASSLLSHLWLFDSSTSVLVLYLSLRLPVVLHCLSPFLFLPPLLLPSCSPLPCCPHISPASFCSCLSKECFNNRMLLHNSGHYANLTFSQCIRNAFFVRVRINLHWVIFIRKGRHTGRYNVFLKKHLRKCDIL